MSVSTVNLSNSKSYIYMHLVSLSAKVSSFLAIIALVFVFSGVEGKSDIIPDPVCGIGEQLEKATYTDEVGCKFDVYFCWQCTYLPNGTYIIRQVIKYYGPQDGPDCRQTGAITEAINEFVFNLVKDKCEMPPCSLGVSKLKIEQITAVCNRIVNVQNQNNGAGPSSFSVYMIPCGNVVCKKTYEVCWDYSTTPPTAIPTFISSTLDYLPLVSSPGNCTSTTYPTLPPTGKTWNEAWESECFSTICN